MPAGAPTKYQDHYPALLLETVTNGATIYSFAALVGVGVNTIVRWRDAHEEFGEVWDAMLARQGAAWEKKLLDLADGKLPGGSSAAILHGVKTRMPKMWGDAPTKLEHTGRDGKPIETVDLSKFSAEELEVYGQLAKKHEAAEGETHDDVERPSL